MGLMVLIDPPDAELVADLDQLDGPLGLLGRDARRMGVEDRSSPSADGRPWRWLMLNWTSRRS